MQPSPQEAAAELLRRRKARTSLAAYANAIDVPGKPASDDEDEWLFHPIETTVAAHHRLIMEALQQIAVTPYGRLMLFLPPGSAKSTYASVVFPTWEMGRKPGSKIILASYGSDLARRHGRRARQIVRSPKYQGIFGAGISSETSAADEWALTNGSEYIAAGLLSGVTGNRASGILIDDPVKGREDADSEVIRKKTREAYEDDLMTRLMPGGWVAIIQTRWHEEDLAGGILPTNYAGESGDILCRDGQVWRVICLPAKCERADDPLGRQPGEYLWPEWFGPKHWALYEGNPAARRTWSALYQQRPTPEDGDYFRREWFRWYDKPPPRDTLQIYGASDYAVKGVEGDFTEHGVFGVDPDDNIFVLDWWRKQTTSDVWVETLLDLGERWKPIGWAEEKGQIDKSVGPFLDRRQLERNVHFAREQFASSADKPTRAQSIRGRMAMGKVYFPRNAPWLADVVRNLLMFPNGAHDDTADVFGLLGRMLDKMVGGTRPKPNQPAPDDPYAKAFEKARRGRGADDWKTI